MVHGGGYEKYAEVRFLDIENIHAMRSALEALVVGLDLRAGGRRGPGRPAEAASAELDQSHNAWLVHQSMIPGWMILFLYRNTFYVHKSSDLLKHT